MWTQGFQPSNISVEVKNSGFYMKLHNFKILDTGFTFFYKNLGMQVGQKSGCSPPKVNHWSKGMSMAFASSLDSTVNK